ncbi:hypothetical protein GCM10023238_39690 [Streptomyces heliomycini]
MPARWIDPGALPEWVRPGGLRRPVGSVMRRTAPRPRGVRRRADPARAATERTFTPDEEAFARLFAARAAHRVCRQRACTASRARSTTTLMRELLPPTLESLHGVDYAGRYRAACDHERIGGDFYDVHPGGRRLAGDVRRLGDVAGKGLEAAVLTGRSATRCTRCCPWPPDHQQVLTLLNGALLSSHHTRFATLVLASVGREAAGCV